MAEDPRIEELIRAGRRRNAIGYTIFGVLLIVAGAITLVVVLTQDVDLANTEGRRSGGGYQVVIYAGGAIVIGVVLLVMALKALRVRGDQPPDVALKKAEPLD